MSADDIDSESSSSKWQSIRPWNPRFSLSVREITSVSATFVILSLSNLPSSDIIINDHDSFNLQEGSPTSKINQSIVPDTLSKGVSVKVNGSPWQKCLARLADNADEAMIIIYGLMPGRHYDIELGVIPGGEKLQGQIVTESVASDNVRSNSDGTPQLNGFSSTASHALVIDHSSPSPPSPPPPLTPSGPSYSSQTYEDYLATLQLSLSHLQAEHETLSNSLRSARRDSQKAQASQRTEIASLKRAAQKHSAGDTRMKQKVRALEEAVKQATKCREDVEAEYAILETTRIEQEAELSDASHRFEEARDRAEEWRTRREKAEEEASNKLQGAKAELAAVEARLEKLRAKREKLEGRACAEEDEDSLDTPSGLVGELEIKLREMLLERERIDADPYGHIATSHYEDADKSVTDARAQGHSPNHGRNTHHSPAHPPRAKRSAPPFSHQPSHSHSHAHSRTATFTSPTSPSAPRTAAPALTRNHLDRGSAKGSVARRKSSPPPHSQADRSALSLNAPPFEPASIKGKANPGRSTS
ncbi:hypothetical protein B0F90DRAFT_1188195 [Multifurca ochricompacta]|uniref:Uncharacterized protein n=1 Tax=Multifurca ochricompacta TaxID=376703 RepID=A0AAD4MA68_9AGAM|nr:hypothetical protein B0F90DRAFT_1188195 [Multifurca ochricompacta]